MKFLKLYAYLLSVVLGTCIQLLAQDEVLQATAIEESSLLKITAPEDSTPFKKATLALSDLSFNSTQKKAVLDKMEKELQKYFVSAAVETKDYKSLALLAKFKRKLMSMANAFVEPSRHFAELVRNNKVLNSSTQNMPHAAISTAQLLENNAPSVEAVVRIDTLCLLLFKATLEDAALSMVLSICNITRDQLTQSEDVELVNLANIFGVLVRQNIAKALSTGDLDEFIQFFSNPLFIKLKSQMPMIFKLFVDTYAADERTRAHLYKLIIRIYK